VSKGEKMPVMVTGADVKKISLEAESVTYSKQGALPSVMNKVYCKLGITDQMESKIRFPGHGELMEAVAHGKSKDVFTRLSKILGEPRIEHVTQSPLIFRQIVFLR
jgi:hypothetical protein